VGARPREGLAGLDLLRRFVTEVDGPARIVRLHPRTGFVPPAGAERIAVRRGHRAVVAPGAVDGVGEGSFVLDTGASIEVVVTAYELVGLSPRRRGAAASLGRRDEARSPDYWTEVPGLAVGPFRFPATTIVGRDRERDRVGGSLGLVGMGLLRHLRVAYDLDHASLWAVPGPSYRALVAAGLEVEDGPGGSVAVTRVVPGGSAAAAGVRLHDVVLAVDGQPVRGGAEAVRAALGVQGAARRRLRLGRDGAMAHVVVALSP
jgi:hypothetical protein